MREWIEWSSHGIQALAVVVIVFSIVYGSFRFLRQLSRHATDPYRAYKQLLGRSLLLALEFLVAADVIRTVLLDLTAKGMEILGALVVVRTFLSWSLVLELEGHWPWQSVAGVDPSKRPVIDEIRKDVPAAVGELEKPAQWAVEVPAPPAA